MLILLIIGIVVLSIGGCLWYRSTHNQAVDAANEDTSDGTGTTETDSSILDPLDQLFVSIMKELGVVER